jgi:hypothetical protein
VAKLHVAEWARKDLATTELCVQQKACSFGPFNIFKLGFLPDCPVLSMDEMALFQSTLITSAVVLSLPALSNDACTKR